MRIALLTILMVGVLLLPGAWVALADTPDGPLHAGISTQAVTPEVTASAVGLVEEVEPGMVTYSDIVTFEYVAGGSAPGTNYDGILASDGVRFAERFAGQSIGYVTIGRYVFDVLAGTPTNPLSLQIGLPKQNVNVFAQSGYGNVVCGLGPLGYPDYDAIGEGAIAVLFPNPQTSFAIDIMGVDGGGVATFDFFKFDGTSLGTITVSPSNRTYGFKTTTGLPDIAGFSIYNTDPAGLGYDNLRFTLVPIRFPVDNPTDGTFWHHSPGSPYHRPSSGLGGADDTYALDLNWRSGADDLGKPVYAVHDGVIEQVDKAWGWVLIRHHTALEWRGQTHYTWYSGYAHMRNIPKDLKPGVSIGISTQIGEVAGVGKGKSFSPHLHFAVYVGRTKEKGSLNDFLESVDAGEVAGPAYGAYIYYDAIYNHNVDESVGHDANHWFEGGGSEGDWSETTSYGFSGHMFYTNTEKSEADNWGRWNHILLADGQFTVMAFIPANYGTTKLATYVISVNGALMCSKTLSQNSYSDKWVILGTVNCSAGDRLDVYLDDKTGENKKYVAYDTIKIWMKQDLALPRS